MKMRKLLATAVAATMAVTSLATVASAADLTFNMAHTKGTVKFNITKYAEFSDQYSFTEDQITAGATLGSSADTVTISLGDEKAVDRMTGVTLNVTGVKGTRSSASKTYSYKFTEYYADGSQNYDAPGLGGFWKLEIKEDKGTESNHFVPGQFVEITKMEVVADFEKDVTTAKEYDSFGSTEWGVNSTLPNTQWPQLKVEHGWTATGVGAEVANLLNTVGYYFGYASEKSTTNYYPFLSITDGYNTTGWDKYEEKYNDDTLERFEIKLLSDADDYKASNPTGSDDNQSYNDDHMGTNPKDFAGLASQVADFFNKQTNGKITFKFTTAAATSGTDWSNGGVPSTQVGLKNALGDATKNDFVLFFNYRETGSLQALTEIDASSGEVTFDISEVLDALGGQTIGVIQEIYYGMTDRAAINYDKDVDGDLLKEGKGLCVESITLSYDEDADVEADIEDDVEVEDDADDVEIEEDDDVEIEDDADDAEEDDADTDGDVIVETEDDDANPGTGVALAVVPAMVAAAAVVLSKKRK